MLEENHQKYRDRYYAKFGEDFPSMEVGAETIEEEIEAIDKCLSANEPAKVVFSIDYNENIQY